jgi:hypothetical protein
MDASRIGGSQFHQDLLASDTHTNAASLTEKLPTRRAATGELEGLPGIKRLPKELVAGILAHVPRRTLNAVRLAGKDDVGLRLKAVAETITQSIKVTNRTDLANALAIYTQGGLSVLTA